MPQTQQKPQPGFVVLPTEEEALRYPVAPGNSITIKIESQPVIIEKTMGFSQFDCPQIRKYRIVEEEAPKETAPEKSDITRIDERLDRIEEELEKMKNSFPKRPVKKEVKDE
jgi:hypothetical protein